MTTRIVRDGIRTLSLSVDAEGWASYAVTILVQSDDKNDGPFTAANTPGLPLYGAPWNWKNDFDPWATRRHDFTVKEVPSNQDVRHFELVYNYRVKPDGKSCYETQIQDPLLQPMKISGTFAKDKEQGLKDRFGQAIHNSAFEVIHGPQNEWDGNRPQVTIQQYVPALQIELFAPMQNTVNDAPLWGLNRRCWLLTTTPWERQFRGVCERYYSRTLTFDGKRDGWDRDLQDEGTKCLRGHWHPKVNVWIYERDQQNCVGVNDLPNRFNPAHFQRAVDRNGNHIKVVLNGAGRPYNPDNFTYTFQGTQAQAKAEADAASAAFLGPYASESAANAACCAVAGTGTHLPTPTGLIWVCIGANSNVPVEDTRFWVERDGTITFPSWEAGVFYVRGSTVNLLPSSAAQYIATAHNIDLQPGTPGAENSWRLLTFGLNNKGGWKANTGYVVGDYVDQPEPPGLPASGTGTHSSTWWCISGVGDASPGTVHVEFYRESNFLQLGIPVTLI